MTARAFPHHLLAHPLVLWALSRSGRGEAPIAGPEDYLLSAPVTPEGQDWLAGAERRILQSREAEEGVFDLVAAGTSCLFLRLPEAALIPHEGFAYQPLRDCPLRGALYEMLARPAATLEVICHWHHLEDAESARSWSRLRAVAIANHLIADLQGHGGGAARVRATGLGCDFPVTGSLTASGRRRNRRVELVLRAGALPEEAP